VDASHKADGSHIPEAPRLAAYLGFSAYPEGESLAYVRDQLGHSSIKITVDTYGHLVPGANKAAVDRLDELIGRNLYATGSKQPGRLPARKET
jgi:hypothetical protein